MIADFWEQVSRGETALFFVIFGGVALIGIVIWVLGKIHGDE
jgi:hypothetical protein